MTAKNDRRVHWCDTNSKTLVHKVVGLNLKQEDDIPWAELINKGWNVWPANKLQERWAILKVKVDMNATHCIYIINVSITSLLELSGWSNILASPKKTSLGIGGNTNKSLPVTTCGNLLTTKWEGPASALAGVYCCFGAHRRGSFKGSQLPRLPLTQGLLGLSSTLFGAHCRGKMPMHHRLTGLSAGLGADSVMGVGVGPITRTTRSPPPLPSHMLGTGAGIRFTIYKKLQVMRHSCTCCGNSFQTITSLGKHTRACRKKWSGQELPKMRPSTQEPEINPGHKCPHIGSSEKDNAEEPGPSGSNASEFTAPVVGSPLPLPPPTPVTIWSRHSGHPIHIPRYLKDYVPHRDMSFTHVPP
ncbi:hypothetical protein EI94DRAFT_1704130 [Lactarius quietus]|nr:hypothetical protein EI94DRAFT_1704130 [Lactarius quietus]